MIANIITLARIVLVFVVVVLFQLNNVYTRLFATLMVVVVISLDSLDGYVARKMNVASDFGALFDITGDRIIENVFWIYFAVAGFIGYWVPLIIISRSFIVDAVRAVAFRKGKTAFGKQTMMKSALTFPMPIAKGMTMVISMMLEFHIVLLLQNMISTSNLVLFRFSFCSP